ncbi:hypothetical protein MA16_Dca016237 [Dendrobium catenatum]|uniref:Uncharacterized protein n=1 Tax=Dendrobium catenatum TaxID=906689 RepID=A0A2I0VVS6_9ASPA|nr:hypothetical protein MA16_Dca016237 [Dendrobium catenatum]
MLTEINPNQEPKQPSQETRRPHETKGPRPRERAQAQENQRPAGIPRGKAQKTISHGGNQGVTSWEKIFLGIPKAGLTCDEDGFIDIIQSTFFDVNTRVDHTAEDYIERILDTLVEAIEEQFKGVEWRISTAP